MKHFARAFGLMFPEAKPLLDAMEKDAEEMDLEHQRQRLEFEERRRKAEERHEQFRQSIRASWHGGRR